MACDYHKGRQRLVCEEERSRVKPRDTFACTLSEFGRQISIRGEIVRGREGSTLTCNMPTGGGVMPKFSMMGNSILLGYTISVSMPRCNPSFELPSTMSSICLGCNSIQGTQQPTISRKESDSEVCGQKRNSERDGF